LLRDVNGDTIRWFASRLNIETELHWASALAVDEQNPTQPLVEICRYFGASGYLSGADGRNYLDVERFSTAGIEVIFQEYVPESYSQLFGGFESHLSAIDLILNCGPESANVLRTGRRPQATGE
jgi:hypothetical protein